MNLLNYFRKNSKIVAIGYDLLAIIAAWYFAYWLRANMQFLPNELFKSQSIYALNILAVIQISAYYYFKVYRGLWRFASVDDVQRIVRSVLATVLVMVVVSYLLQMMIPRSILPIYALALITFQCGARLSVRLMYDRQSNLVKSRDAQKVLIVGAGQAGEGLLREIKRSRDYIAIGIVDDANRKQGLDIHGVRVLGSIATIPVICANTQVDLIMIAIASANSSLMRTVVGYCEQTQVPFQTLPDMDAISACQVNMDYLRTVGIEDLLGRDQVQIEWDKIADSINAKKVLVSGGGGSIGSELCRQIARFSPKSLMILDNNEYNLYAIDVEFTEKYPNINHKVSLTSVNDKVGIKKVFANFKPDVVFHAAAYKHVPMLESQVRIAVDNNIIGTKVLAEASVASMCEKFILISTDKAVNPTNVMGTTKRVAEIYCQNLNKRVATQFITVRFGNVLGSTGSVVPLFQQQLKSGGPLTVTHPDMQRYFMTIPEATRLILQAMVNGDGGEIFVLDMGEPVKISYLAEQIIRLAGLEPGRDIEIKYTGLRPGEKLFEELFHAAEELATTRHKKLLRAKYRESNWEDLLVVLQKLEKGISLQDSDDDILALLKGLVPEFTNVKNNSKLEDLEVSV